MGTSCIRLCPCRAQRQIPTLSSTDPPSSIGDDVLNVGRSKNGARFTEPRKGHLGWDQDRIPALT